MFSGIGAPELALILVIVLILFGAGRLPQVFEQFGRGIRAFRDAQKEEPIDVTRAESVKKDPAQLAHDDLNEAVEVKEKAKSHTA
ncbi:MAG: twin-arginine translocase TatA/TatE family subunit [Myxococcota bacterium]